MFSASAPWTGTTILWSPAFSLSTRSTPAWWPARQYYAAVFGQGKVYIFRRKAEEIKVLATADISYQEGDWHDFRFDVKGNTLTMYVDGQAVCSCKDTMYTHGAAGYVVDEDAIVAETFTVTGL